MSAWQFLFLSRGVWRKLPDLHGFIKTTGGEQQFPIKGGEGRTTHGVYAPCVAVVADAGGAGIRIENAHSRTICHAGNPMAVRRPGNVGLLWLPR